MATRLYPVTGTPGITPAVMAGWEQTSPSFLRQKFDTNSANFTASGSDNTNGDGVAGDDTCRAQFIYGPIGAQTITGTVKGQFAARMAAAGTNARAQITIRVLASDGTTSRGTLLDFDTAADASDFNVSATVRINRKFPRTGAVSLSSVSSNDGDYIVVEIGFRNHGTNTGAARITWVDGTDGDLPEDETTTDPNAAPAFRPWIEFSQTIVGQASDTSGSGAVFDQYGNIYYSDVDVTLDNVTNVVDNVLINSSGITITDGALVVSNPGGTVIIDGTSDMFKIAATGTISATGNGLNNHVTQGVVLTALGTYTALPALLTMIGQPASATLQATPGGVDPFSSSRLFAASTSAGSPTTGFAAPGMAGLCFSGLNGSSNVVIDLDVISSVGWAEILRYYVLTETAF